jgi:hypothetical protein
VFHVEILQNDVRSGLRCMVKFYKRLGKIEKGADKKGNQKNDDSKKKNKKNYVSAKEYREQRYKTAPKWM